MIVKLTFIDECNEVIEDTIDDFDTIAELLENYDEDKVLKIEKVLDSLGYPMI